jgi:hypothetical protein
LRIVIRLPSFTPTRIVAGSGARAEGKVARVAGAEQLAERRARTRRDRARTIEHIIGTSTM